MTVYRPSRERWVDINNLNAEQRKDLRGYFGGGADTRFWRAYQKAIADMRPDFKPGIYFYVDKRNRNAEDLTRSAQWKSIELGFYTEKQLEGYVYKSKGEINCKHPDTASKIIAHMYLSWGLLRTYDYLLQSIVSLNIFSSLLTMLCIVPI